MCSAALLTCELSAEEARADVEVFQRSPASGTVESYRHHSQFTMTQASLRGVLFARVNGHAARC